MRSALCVVAELESGELQVPVASPSVHCLSECVTVVGAQQAWGPQKAAYQLVVARADPAAAAQQAFGLGQLAGMLPLPEVGIGIWVLHWDKHACSQVCITHRWQPAHGAGGGGRGRGSTVCCPCAREAWAAHPRVVPPPAHAPVW